MLGSVVNLDALGAVLLLTSSVGENTLSLSLLLPSSYSYSYFSTSPHVPSSHFLVSPVLFLRSILCLAAARYFSHTSSSNLTIVFPGGLLSPIIFTIRFGILLSNIPATCYRGKYTCGLPHECTCSALTIVINFFTLIFGGECKFWSSSLLRLLPPSLSSRDVPVNIHFTDTYNVTSSGTVKVQRVDLYSGSAYFDFRFGSRLSWQMLLVFLSTYKQTPG